MPLFQVLLLLQTVWGWTINVPFWDEWETTELVRHAKLGQLHFGEFWIVHNEHRIVLPRIISLTLILATNWNRQIEMTFNILVVIGSVLLLIDCARRTLRSRGALIVLSVLISGLLFSFSQFENWFAPFQITFFATVFGVALAIWAFCAPAGRRGRFALAVAGGLIASLSSLAGLMVWPALFPAALRAGRAKVVGWVLCGVAIGGAYFVDFPRLPREAIAPQALVAYFVAYLGAPLGFPDLARAQALTLVGAALLLLDLLAYWQLKDRLDDLLPWFGLGLFGLACAAITSVGRGPTLGIAQALGSRYHAFAALWWVALCAIAVLTTARIAGRLDRQRGRDLGVGAHDAPPQAAFLRLVAVLNVVLLPVALYGYLQANVAGYETGLKSQLNQRAHEQCIADYEHAPDSCLVAFYPVAPIVRQRAAYLDSEGLARFHKQPETPFSQLRAAPAPAQAAIETVAAVATTGGAPAPVVVPHGRTLLVQGWAVDGETSATASSVWITIDGAFNFRADYGLARDDIATTLRLPATTRPGFQATIPPGLLLPGAHQLTVRVIGADQRSYTQTTQRVDIFLQGFHYAPEVTIPSQTAMGDLVQGMTFSQTFTSRCDRLSQIDLLLATYNRTNTADVVFRLIDVQTNTPAFVQHLPAARIEDNAWQPLLFEPIATSNGRQYRIVIESPDGRAGNAITAWRSAADQYPDGGAFQDSQPLAGDIVFRYGCGD